jgi:hypothetical protein
MKLTRARLLFLSLFLTIVFFDCCKREEKAERNIVQEIQQTGRLVTAEYTVQKLVKAADNRTWYKIGDRKILMSVEARVRAGIDLQQVRKENITIRDSVIQLRLPPPTVFSVSLPPGRIKVQYQEVDFFRTPFSAEEREALLQQAESQVRRLADSLGILETAKAGAEIFFRRLLQGKGYKETTIEFGK